MDEFNPTIKFKKNRVHPKICATLKHHDESVYEATGTITQQQLLELPHYGIDVVNVVLKCVLSELFDKSYKSGKLKMDPNKKDQIIQECVERYKNENTKDC